MKAAEKYEDIIHLERPVSNKHLPMSIRNRAAQFAPFSALTGYEDAIDETARRTEQKVELDENKRELLDEKMQEIKNLLEEQRHPEICITYFQKDEKKAGGHYQTVTGHVKKIRFFEQSIAMEEVEEIPINDVLDIEIVNQVF